MHLKFTRFQDFLSRFLSVDWHGPTVQWCIISAILLWITYLKYILPERYWLVLSYSRGITYLVHIFLKLCPFKQHRFQIIFCSVFRQQTGSDRSYNDVSYQPIVNQHSHIIINYANNFYSYHDLSSNENQMSQYIHISPSINTHRSHIVLTDSAGNSYYFIF